MTKPEDDSSSSARSAEAIRAEIDRNLRRVYDDALEEGVPDRFRQLIDQLRAQSRPSQAKDDQE